MMLAFCFVYVCYFFFFIRPCVISFVFVVCMCRALSFPFSKSSRCRRRRLVFLYDLLLIASRACVLYIFFCGGRGVVWAMLFFVGCVFTPLFSFLMIRSLRHGWWFCLLCVQISWCAPCWFVFLFVLCFGRFSIRIMCGYMVVFIWAIVVGCCFRLFVILIRPYVFLHGFGSHVFGVVGYHVPFLYFVILFCWSSFRPFSKFFNVFIWCSKHFAYLVAVVLFSSGFLGAWRYLR